MHLLPLGDQALLAYCSDETSASVLANRVRRANFPWLLDVVQAYTSVAFFIDLAQVDWTQAEQSLEQTSRGLDVHVPVPGKLHVIPCCYELGPDLERVAEATGLSVADVIGLHTGCVYTVYAIGFCPGFPYLGYLPERLGGVPRLSSPRLAVEEGSVGLTGRQTGIYTQTRPGGWNIIGRTPLRLVDVAAEYFPLRTGDRVRFERIDAPEFSRLRLSARLAPDKR